ncbi:MAG: metal ABC transporter ATP-binding protein [Gemmatimonadales bacterium]
MTPALEVEHLSVTLGRTRVIDDLSFAVQPGSALAIIGPNGAGKTVLLKALIGAIPSEGAIRWHAARIGYVPQKLDIERDLPLTGSDLLRAKAEVTHDADSEIARVLALVELPPEVADQRIGTMSGGQFQRLLLAFALMGRPSILLFDEPTAGVDEVGEENIYTLFDRLQHEEGLTVILVSHELSLVYRFADNVLCLSRRTVFFGPPVEILTPERLQQAYGVPMKFHEHDRASPH